RVDQELRRVEPLAGLRLVRAVDAVAVPLAGPDAGQVAVPVEDGAVDHLDDLLAVVLVEQAELDALGVLGEEREVRALAVPHRPERERPAGPDLPQRRSSTVFAAKSATSSTSPRRTRRTRRRSSTSVSAPGGSVRRSAISSL